MIMLKLTFFMLSSFFLLKVHVNKMNIICDCCATYKYNCSCYFSTIPSCNGQWPFPCFFLCEGNIIEGIVCLGKGWWEQDCEFKNKRNRTAKNWLGLEDFCLWKNKYSLTTILVWSCTIRWKTIFILKI